MHFTVGGIGMILVLYSQAGEDEGGGDGEAGVYQLYRN